MSDTREQAGAPLDDGSAALSATASLTESKDISQRDDVAKLRKNAIGLGMVALISVLAWFDVRLSSMVLGVALISEVVILVIFDIAMFAHGGLPLASLNPVNAFKGFPSGANEFAAGAAGIGIFFAFWSWVGFEMAPNYAEESRHPKKIVPRATYISVIGLGVFYLLTSWAPFAGYSSVHAAQVQ